MKYVRERKISRREVGALTIALANGIAEVHIHSVKLVLQHR